MSKLRHFDNLGTVRFVTISCYQRRRLLEDDSAKKILLEEIKAATAKYHFKLFAFAVMPNHAHLVLLPPDGFKLGKIIGEIKALTTRRINLELCGDGGTHKTLWTPRCYDHNCRTPETVIEKINYCHNNPVRAGLVSDPGSWPWSSYSNYSGEGKSLISIDIFDGASTTPF